MVMLHNKWWLNVNHKTANSNLIDNNDNIIRIKMLLFDLSKSDDVIGQCSVMFRHSFALVESRRKIFNWNIIMMHTQQFCFVPTIPVNQ